MRKKKKGLAIGEGAEKKKGDKVSCGVSRKKRVRGGVCTLNKRGSWPFEKREGNEKEVVKGGTES